jgi:hypothetical protein
MVMLFIFCGLLEFVGGSFIAAVVYLISMNANVPTGFFILPILKACNIDLWKETMEYIDVGASLGIMGCAGALLQFLKYRRRLLLIGVVVTILLAVVQRFYFGVDHTFAILLGYLIGHACLHWGYPKTNCKKLFISSKDPSSYNSPIPFRSRPR